ncbi:unnamed protein product [Schistosoma curassoni]|uniref:Uncharacterized protein n=1 Tax=Schistosoma curassoni TaxID=6186 RepID=A0A183K6X3_9TREM|nr:unnamed protein product [Schistosoma curassoni]
MYLHPIVNVHSGTRTQYLSLQTLYKDSGTEWITRWCLNRMVLVSSPGVNINYEMQVHPVDKSQIERNSRYRFYC